MSNIRKIREAHEYVVELVKGFDASKTPFFAYILLQKSNLQLFKEKLATNDTKLSDYGVVLASGAGHNPSLEIVKQVKKKLASK